MEKYFIEIKPNSEAFRGHNIGWYTYANSIEEATPENPFVLPEQGDYDYDVTVVTVENTDGKEEQRSKVCPECEGLNLNEDKTLCWDCEGQP